MPFEAGESKLWNKRGCVVVDGVPYCKSTRWNSKTLAAKKNKYKVTSRPFVMLIHSR